MSIGDRIRLRRNQLDKTLEEVGKIVGVTRATIQRYENGNIQNIPSDKIELLAKALKTTPAYIMGWEDDETIKQNVQERKIIESFNQLNDEGKEKVIAYTQDLVDSGKYALDQNLSRATQAQIDQEVEAYRKELELQARATKSSQSEITNEEKNKLA